MSTERIAKLEQELTKLKHGDHICSIFEDTAEQLAAAVPFIIDGLARGERCVYITDHLTVKEVGQALQAAGVDVEREGQRGALRILTKEDTCLATGEIGPQALFDFIRQAEAQALADGFSGLRQIGEMTWVLGPEPGCDRLIEFEALVDQWLANSKTVGLCLYKSPHFNAPCIHDVFRTHGLVILGDQLCPNPYYESPEMVLSKDETRMSPEFKAKRVDWWMAQLERARAVEHERERALEKLKQSERRLAEAQRVAHIGSWERDLRTNQVTWSDELYRLFDLEPDEVALSYQEFLDRVMPQDVDRIRALVDEAIRERRGFNCDYRITLSDGSVHVLNDRGSVILDEEGAPIRLVGTCHDVTELRQAEQALQEYAARLQTLSRRLLAVQEEERRHLARELHDEIGQVLSAISVNLQALIEVCDLAAQPRLDESIGIVDRAIQQVRNLSLDLRPSMLDDLGLVPTLRWYADRQAQRAGFVLHFVAESSGDCLPADLEIACYRVVQEALTNVVRHAQARQVWLEVREGDDQVELLVRDDGVGFDPAAVRRRAVRGASFGLLGMQERVEMLGGHIDIESAPTRGTTVRARFSLAGTPAGEDAGEETTT